MDSHGIRMVLRIIGIDDFLINVRLCQSIYAQQELKESDLYPPLIYGNLGEGKVSKWTVL